MQRAWELTRLLEHCCLHSDFASAKLHTIQTGAFDGLTLTGTQGFLFTVMSTQLTVETGAFSGSTCQSLVMKGPVSSSQLRLRPGAVRSVDCAAFCVTVAARRSALQTV